MFFIGVASMGFPHLIPHGPHYKFYTISYLIFLGFFIPGPALVLAVETLKAMSTAKNGFFTASIFFTTNCVIFLAVLVGKFFGNF